MDSYSESFSSNNESSDNRTVTADSDSSATPDFEEAPCEWEADSKGIEATLHQIAAGLQSAAEGYLALASHMSKVAPYELPQVIAQIPPPPMDVPMPIRRALLIDGESKAVNYLICGEYEPLLFYKIILMLILTVTLVDQLLQKNVYKVHNLPMLHRTLNVHVQYELEGAYFTTLMEGMFISLPTALDVKLCLVTNGYLCMFNQALYPVEHSNWCICFIHQ